MRKKPLVQRIPLDAFDSEESDTSIVVVRAPKKASTTIDLSNDFQETIENTRIGHSSDMDISNNEHKEKINEDDESEDSDDFFLKDDTDSEIKEKKMNIFSVRLRQRGFQRTDMIRMVRRKTKKETSMSPKVKMNRHIQM